MPEKKLTLEQSELVREFASHYGLLEEQIGFDGEKPDPIFDFDAICLLREKLTDFKAVDASAVEYDEQKKEAQAVCVILLQNGNTVTVSDFAELGEPMPDGSLIQNSIKAKRVARARAMRTGIRACGVNLLQAHRAFVETGKIPQSAPVDPRISKIKEVHLLAGKLDLIVGTEKEEYQRFLAQLFDGRVSCNDLDDIELQRLLISLRAMNRLRKINQEKLAA